MTIEQKLKSLILERYGTMSDFTNKINIPYSTMTSIFKRGINNATISNILKICQELKINADDLAKGEIVSIYQKADTQSNEVLNILANTKHQLLNTDGLMFNGQPVDKASVDSILSAMEIGINLANQIQNNRR